MIILKNQTLSMGLQENKGLPVGNLTSQFFANIYLNHLDHYIKHELGYRAYVRYMDDFVLWCDDSESLKSLYPHLSQRRPFAVLGDSLQLSFPWVRESSALKSNDLAEVYHLAIFLP